MSSHLQVAHQFEAEVVIAIKDRRKEDRNARRLAEENIEKGNKDEDSSSERCESSVDLQQELNLPETTTNSRVATSLPDLEEEDREPFAARQMFIWAVRLVINAMGFIFIFKDIATRWKFDDDVDLSLAMDGPTTAKAEQNGEDEKKLQKMNNTGLILNRSDVLTGLFSTTSPGMRDEAFLKIATQKMKQLSSFAEYPRHIQEKICSIGEYQYLEPNRQIVRQGQNAENFYFLLHGTVKIDHINPEGEHSSDLLKSGACFGEIEVLYEIPHTWSFMSGPKGAHVLIIPGFLFYPLFDLNWYADFVKSVDLLRHFPADEIPSNLDDVRVQYFRKGKLVVRDSSENDWIYVVVRGSLQVFQTIGSIREEVQGNGRLSMKDRLNVQLPSVESKIRSLPPEAISRGIAASKMSGIRSVMSSMSIRSQRPTKHEVVQVDLLKHKDTFGLADLPTIATRFDPQSLSVASLGCECVLIKKPFFQERITHYLQQDLMLKVKKYPPMLETKERLEAQLQWDRYRRQTLEKSRPPTRKSECRRFVFH